MSNTITLTTPISALIANKRRVSALKGLGMVSVGDALTYYPFRVTEPVPLRAIREAKAGMPMAFAAVVRFARVIPMGGRRGFRLEAVVDDGAFAASRQIAGSSCRLVFFSHKKQYMDWMSGRLHSGADVVLAGTPTEFNGQLQFTHPEVLTVMPQGANVFADPATAPGSASAGELSFDTISNRANAQPEPHGSVFSDAGVPASHSQPTQAVNVSARRQNPATATSMMLNQTRVATPQNRNIYVQTQAANALEFDASTAYEALQHVCRPRPVYHATSRISTEHIHESIVAMLDALRTSGEAALRKSANDGNGLPVESSQKNNDEISSSERMSRADNGSVAEDSGLSESDDENSNSGNNGDIVTDAADSDTADNTADNKAKVLALRAAIDDVLPREVIESKQLMHRADAFAAIHDPQSTKAFYAALATLRYEEAFVSQISVLQERENARKAETFECKNSGLRDGFVTSLPFTLTKGQQNVIDTICEDMGRSYPMQRLLQGEVGSGKTVVALAAMLQAVGSGNQAVLVAPTQVLAEQHFETISGMVAKIVGGDAANASPIKASAAGGPVAEAGEASAAGGQNPKAGKTDSGALPTGGFARANDNEDSAVPDLLEDAADEANGHAGNIVTGHQVDSASAKAYKASKVSKTGGANAKVSGIGKTGKFVSRLAIPVTLLTGGMKLAARRKALATAASGEPGIIIATHAAFSKMFQAPNLALVVIDEQHRFGVEQREILRSKGEKTPHLLVMTATPIPRTAAMTWFGDLDISWLTELPGGRKPIRTFIVPEADGNMMAQMFVHIRRRIDAGERAYVVCPRIDADEADAEALTGVGGVTAAEASVGASSGRHSRRKSSMSDGGSDDIESGFVEVDDYGDENGDGTPPEPKPPLHAVDEIAQRLSSLPQFAGIKFATLTGRDDDETKRQVMADFESGKTPILVATTVIEVGVDVPKASCITIFDADRYGLSQLHQLRGRVGRGGTDSWAFLVSRAEPGSIAEQRLKVIEGSLDGAEIAQADLELRGAGDVLGDAQSGGKSGLKLLRVVKDAKIIADAREQAEALLKRDPTLSDQPQLAGAVLDFTRGGESEILSN
ncbi:DEAD/DEAH box helicase [Bifidobacterium sp. ESL0745]|uniref:ATP-dependent DNA helicase RecG n=1 Tax=Bifidobacterium sp. ESL0745 TaxID=2983226 RepID=UPI0023F65D76|nr:DEAD/DEAH box helicase [Bifidobacterium sp. ESL0745]MDF7666073.1 helicase-related protein [Bifidobacterium sp. ESL0745]